MTKRKTRIPVKVQMTVYVEPEVKKGMKIAATVEGMTTSKLVEQICLDYLLVRPAEESKL